MSDDDNKDKIVPPTPPADDKGDGKGGDDKGGDKKALSQEDVDKILNERLERANKKFQEDLATERKKWEDDAKLSEKERLEKERVEKEKETAEKENNISLRENRLALVEKMAEAKVPTVFADFLVTNNTEKTIENFNTFKTAWEKSLEEYIKDKMSTETIRTENQVKDNVTKSGNAVLNKNGQAIL